MVLRSFLWLVVRYVTVLQKLGFASRWVDWMLLRVASVNCFMLIIIDLVGSIFPSRCLNQDSNKGVCRL